MFWVSQSLFYYKLFLTWPNPFKVQGPKQRCWRANRQQCFEPVWATHWWTDSKLPSVSQGEEETGRQRSPQNTAPSKSLSTALLFSHRLPPVLSCHCTPSQAHNLQTRQDTGLLVYSLSGLQRSPRRGTPSYIQKKPPSPGAGLALATLPLAFSQTAK